MRVLSVLIALLALTGEARADVFVPADPPPLGDARCGVAAGDVVAADTNRVLVVSIAGGPWLQIPGLNGCPAIAAAADGTTAIVASDSNAGGAALVIRPPAGTFGTPVPLGDGGDTPAVAAAPGGWTVVSWQSHGEDPGLTAMIVRPDGTTARALLDRAGVSRGDRRFVGHPQVAIDASGNSTIVWAEYTGSKSRLRTARGIAGGPPVVGPELPGKSAKAEAFGVAVAPTGHTLLTWATEDGLQAMVDGRAPQTVDATTTVSQLAVSIADDGAAVIVYSSSADEVVAVDRAAGGAWAIPHVLAAPARREQNEDYSSDDPPALALIGPGGRAVAAWPARRDDVVGVAATVGQAGGAWAPATPLSSITRDAYLAGLTLSATGAPRVFWVELGRGLFGAALAPAPTDTTPPSVTATFPKRVAPTRTGRIAVTVRVRCSEACDARLQASTGEVEGGRVARFSAPGGVARLRLPNAPDFERKLLFNPRSRTVRLDMVVSDRAGNLVRQKHTIRVRVIERPLLELRVAANHRFGMSSAAGDRAVAHLVNELITRAAAHRNGDDEALRRRFHRGVVAIRRAGHKEVDSDNVRQAIYRALELPLTRAGYDADSVTSG